MLYQCLSCQQEQAESTACTICGYPVLKKPFDKKTVLVEQIKSFLHNALQAPLNLEQMTTKELETYKKKQPDAERIMEYCCKSEHSDEFYARLLSSLNLTHDYLTQEQQICCTLEVTNLIQELNKRKQTVYELAKVAHRFPKFEPYEVTPLQLTIQRSPHMVPESYLDFINMCIEWITQLAQFAKKQGIYGNYYKEAILLISSEVEDLSISSLQQRLLEAKNQQLVIDFFSDGNMELKQQLLLFWTLFEQFLRLPNIHGDCVYSYLGTIYNQTTLTKQLENEFQACCEPFLILLETKDSLMYYPMDILVEMYETSVQLEKQLEEQQLLPIGSYKRASQSFIGHHKKKQAIQALLQYDSIESSVNKHHIYVLGEAGTGKKSLVQYFYQQIVLHQKLAAEKFVILDFTTLNGAHDVVGWKQIGLAVMQSQRGMLVLTNVYQQCARMEKKDANEMLAWLFRYIDTYQARQWIIWIEGKSQMEEMLTSYPQIQVENTIVFECLAYSKSELRDICDHFIDTYNIRITHAAKQRLWEQIANDDACNATTIQNWFRTLQTNKQWSCKQDDGSVDEMILEKLFINHRNNTGGTHLWNTIQ